MSSSHNLPLPSALQHLIDSGFWPRTEQESQAQHSKPLIAKAKVQAFAPDEDEIHFYAFPFSTVADYRVETDEAWDKMTAVHLIDPARTLIIADFGIGSDTLIALDYRRDINNPTVIRLK